MHLAVITPCVSGFSCIKTEIDVTADAGEESATCGIIHIGGGRGDCHQAEEIWLRVNEFLSWGRARARE